MNLMPYTENYLKRFLLLFKFVPFFIYIMWASETMSQTNPIVAFETTMGGFSVQLEPKKAPETVKNFLKYVREGLYDGTIFHRVINKFMIQGGGFDTDMKERETYTEVRSLNKKERINEIARMLAGMEVTTESRANAEKMLALK